MPFTMPFATGWTAGAALGTGDIVANFSCFTAATGGLCAWLDGPGMVADDPCDGGLTAPLVGGVGLECVCPPFTPACTISPWRVRASLSTLKPGAGDPGGWLKLKVVPVFDLGPTSLSLVAAGSSTFALASASRLLNASCEKVRLMENDHS